MIEGGVVGDEVEHQSQPAGLQPLPQAGEGGVATQIGMHRVSGDRKPGARDIVLAQVRQRLLELVPPIGLRSRHLLSGWSGAPHAQEPDPVESHLGHAVQVRIGDIVQSGPAAPGSSQLR
jgi:hypothetical protein